MYSIVQYCTILYKIIVQLHCTVLYCCTVYCIVLYVVLYCWIVLYCCIRIRVVRRIRRADPLPATQHNEAGYQPIRHLLAMVRVWDMTWYAIARYDLTWYQNGYVPLQVSCRPRDGAGLADSRASLAIRPVGVARYKSAAGRTRPALAASDGLSRLATDSSAQRGRLPHRWHPHKPAHMLPVYGRFLSASRLH